jgi:sugar fermentation stimulation protein A
MRRAHSAAYNHAVHFPDLIEGRLLRRYFRFLADVELLDGRVVTALVHNTGSLLSCFELGRPVWLAQRHGAGKYKYTLMLVRPRRSLVCIDTAVPNTAVYEGAVKQRIAELAGYREYLSEVAYGEHSRADMLCRVHRDDMLRRCWVEVKSTTLMRDGVAYFPDSVTERGRKHLIELQRMVEYGDRALQVFFVQRGDCASFRPADDIDPEYGKQLRIAVAAGVQAIALQAKVTKHLITIKRHLPVEL